MDDAPPAYPVALLLAGRRCLVVGGGKVAARKIRGLIASGAAVTVVAPEAHEAIGLLASEGVISRIVGPPLDLRIREYVAGEAAGYSLVLTATGDPQIDALVHADAEAAGVWVNSADDVDHCTFILPAVHRDGPVTLAVSTSGQSPALASWLRDRLAATLGTGVGELARLLGDARRRVKERGSRTEAVDWPGLLEGPLPALVADGRLDEARSIVDSEIDRDGRTEP